MLALLWVIFGSALGGSTRYLLHFTFSQLEKEFPFIITAINLFGCLVIGIVTILLTHTIDNKLFLSHFLIIGFCGSFTTFSTFCKENLTLIQNGQFDHVFLHLIINVGLGILFVFLGYKIGIFISKTYLF